jgi:hypothetical protein
MYRLPFCLFIVFSFSVSIGLFLTIPQTPLVIASQPTSLHPRTSAQRTANSESQGTLFWIRMYLPTKFTSKRTSGIAFDRKATNIALASINAGSDNMLRSLDGGRTWSALPNWNPSDTRFSFTVTYGGQSGVFYAWGGTQIYKTTDYGDSWTLVPYWDLCGQILSFKNHPTQPDIFYVIGSNAFTWSFDGGQTWNPDPGVFGGCFGGTRVISLDVGTDQPNIVYRRIERTPISESLQRSDDQGKTWKNINIDVSVGQIIVDPRNADTVFALGGGGTVYKTTNGGQQWTAITQGLDNILFSSLYFDEQTYTLYGMTMEQIYFLKDGSNQWQIQKAYVPPQISTFRQSFRLVIHPQNKEHFFIYSADGIFFGQPERDRSMIPIIYLW